jgi:hypothetical protein
MNKLEEHFRRVADTQELSFYAVLDGAAIPNLLDKLYAEDGPEFECLYRGELEPDIAEVAPYLVKLDLDSDFFQWLLSGAGQAWGIYCYCDASIDMAAVRRHFRKLNMVSGPDGKLMLFRYFDPRVLSSLLPICDAAQRRQIFQSGMRLVCEVEGKETWTQFALAEDGQLVAIPAGA